jgi:hypothetical protein
MFKQMKVQGIFCDGMKKFQNVKFNVVGAIEHVKKLFKDTKHQYVHIKGYKSPC